MNVRRPVTVFAGLLSVGVCVYITWISRSVDLSSLSLNLAFLAIMVITLAVSLFTGLLRIAGITKGLNSATAAIKEQAVGESALSFQNSFLDTCYQQYLDMLKQNPDGSCDIQDFINEDVVDTHIHRGLLELVPDILTSLGILGTFIGLVLGLRSFDPSGYEEMADSVSPLIDGIKVAFVTSIYGLSLSLPFSFELRSELSSFSSALDAFLDAFYLHVRPSHETDTAAKLLAQQKNQDELTNELTGIFVAQMGKSFEESITPAFTHMTESIDRIVETFTQTQTQALSQICQSVMKEIQAELTSSISQIDQTVNQMGQAAAQNAAQLGQATANLADAQSRYSDFTDNTLLRLQKIFSAYQKQVEETESYSRQTLASLSQAQQEALHVSDAQKAAYEEVMRITEEQKATYQEYIRFMYQTIQDFSELWERSNEQLRAYTAQISEMDPVQSSRSICQQLEKLSTQIYQMQQSQLALSSGQSSDTDSQSEEMIQQILHRLDELQQIAESPVLFRRRKKKG